jgi:nitrate/nitrite transporter NarK
VKYYLAAAALLLAFCVAMLGANAGLTYHVVKMSQETRLESSGKLTDRSGSRVVGEWAAGSAAGRCAGAAGGGVGGICPPAAAGSHLTA